MAKRLILGVLLAVVAVSSLVGVWLLRGGDGSTRAQGEAVEMGIDPEVTGNTASTLGTLQDCVRIDVASPAFDGVSDYDIDVYVQGDTQAPAAYDAWVTYDATKVHIASPDTNTLIKLPGAGSFGDAVPDSDGRFVAGAAYLSGGAGIAGDGSLVRLGLDIGGSGLVTLDFDPQPAGTSYVSAGGEHPITRSTAQLAINEDCPPGGRAEPTPTPEDEGKQATPTPASRLELERLRLEEEAKPRFDGVLNGIRLYTGGGRNVERKNACTGAGPDAAQEVPMDAIVGTPMEIAPSYLPANAKEQPPMWPPVGCNGIVTDVERWWVIPGKGNLFIARRQGEHAVASGSSADRVSAATVGGKPAVLVAPLTPDGYGQSLVIVAEDFGLTIVFADGLPLAETVKVAEGLK